VGRGLVRYGAAVLGVVSATVIQGALSPFLPPSQFLFFYPAIFVIARFAGLGPGVLAVLLSACSIAFFFLPPSLSVTIGSSRDKLDLGIFILLALAVTFMLDRLQNAMRTRDHALRVAQKASAGLADQQALREEFVAVVTHDMRTPISTIRLGLQAALRHRTGAEDAVVVPAKTLDRMHRCADRLAAMVAELLDASQVELSQLKLDRAEVDLGRFVAELVEEMRPSLRGHAVVTELPNRPVAASVDSRRLAQVVTNLLDNASKYSRPESTIHVAVSEEEGGPELTVTDEGPGIAVNDVPKLFDRFYQARRTREHKGGLGLGLYIAKGIVDAHGGRLSVDSAQGKGSTFRIALPR
jgi:signal transduction histidine kinase